MDNDRLREIWWLAILLLLIGAAMALQSCATKKNTDVERHRTTEYVYRTDTLKLRDSIVFRDSVFVTQYQRGDTVYRDRIAYKVRDRFNARWRVQWRDSVVRDTVYIAKIQNKAPRSPVSVIKRSRWVVASLWGLLLVVGLVLLARELR